MLLFKTVGGEVIFVLGKQLQIRYPSLDFVVKPFIGDWL